MITSVLAIFIACLLSYGLLLLIIPKGNNLYEVLRLPIFWYHTMVAPSDNILEEKIKYGHNRNQYLLFLQPKKNTSKKTSRKHIVIHFHGGGWLAGKPEMFRTIGQPLLDEGYLVILPNYRKVPFVSFDEIRTDINLILEKTLSIMKEKNLTDKKIVFSGMSAGANLAALLMYDKDEFPKIKNENRYTLELPNRISGAFLCGAPLNIKKMPWSIPLYLFAGNKKGRIFKKANPIEHVQGDEHFRILIAHGTKDGMVAYRNAVSFYEKIKSYSPDKVELFVLENGSHLDAAKWGHSDNELRKKFLNWLNVLENEN